MSYIRAKLVEVEEGDASRGGRIQLELPDHDEAGREMEVDCNLDDELLSAAVQILDLIDGLPGNQALVVWKVIL